MRICCGAYNTPSERVKPRIACRPATYAPAATCGGEAAKACTEQTCTMLPRPYRTSRGACRNICRSSARCHSHRPITCSLRWASNAADAVSGLPPIGPPKPALLMAKSIRPKRDAACWTAASMASSVLHSVDTLNTSVILYCDASICVVSCSPASLVSTRANWWTPCWASEYAVL
jgi:hypothetical protein